MGKCEGRVCRRLSNVEQESEWFNFEELIIYQFIDFNIMQVSTLETKYSLPRT